MQVNQLFANKGRSGAVSTPLDSLLAGIQGAVNVQGIGFATKDVARAAMSLESIDLGLQQELNESVGELNTALESIYATHQSAFAQPGADGKIISSLSVAQKSAGIAAGIISADVQGFLRAPLNRQPAAMENQAFLMPTGGDFLAGRIAPALEAYDERENKNVVVYSVAYNMQAARQDEFGETFFPTVVVTPDQFGITASIRLVQVYNEIRRAISGDPTNFGKRNIIQAVIDPTILKNDTTKVVPVVRNEALNHFVAAALVAPYNVVIDGNVSVSTAPLKIGSKLSLLGISQTDALLETGIMDTTDALDAAITLAKLYITVQSGDGATKEVLSFNTGRLPTATFAPAPQGNYRLMQLNFTNDALLVGPSTKKNNGAASTLLAASIGAGYSVRLSVNVGGSVNLETAETQTFAGEVTVASVTDSNGNVLDITTGQGKTIADLFLNAAVVGYDLDSHRTNSNRRQRGQLLDTTFYNQIYAVPLRAPMSIPRPLTTGDANDSSDLAALITATHIRTSNAAVEELFKTDAMLAEFVSAKDSIANAPTILGVARFLVTPFYEVADFNVGDNVDSLRSTERAEDIQATLVNKVREMVYRMYTASGYKAAADALAGGVSQTPTVIIGTDPTIARYLMVNGDFRTIGPDFNVKVVSTLNQTMKGKIFMTFGDFSSGKDGMPNPMHFGNMAWKPELTLVLPIHRNGANSKELTVTPSFLHITNLPILARINVSGIEDIISSKVTVNVSQ